MFYFGNDWTKTFVCERLHYFRSGRTESPAWEVCGLLALLRMQFCVLLCSSAVLCVWKLRVGRALARARGCFVAKNSQPTIVRIVGDENSGRDTSSALLCLHRGLSEAAGGQEPDFRTPCTHQCQSVAGAPLPTKTRRGCRSDVATTFILLFSHRVPYAGLCSLETLDRVNITGNFLFFALARKDFCLDDCPLAGLFVCLVSHCITTATGLYWKQLRNECAAAQGHGELLTRTGKKLGRFYRASHGKQWMKRGSSNTSFTTSAADNWTMCAGREGQVVFYGCQWLFYWWLVRVLGIQWDSEFRRSHHNRLKFRSFTL